MSCIEGSNPSNSANQQSKNAPSGAFFISQSLPGLGARARGRTHGFRGSRPGPDRALKSPTTETARRARPSIREAFARPTREKRLKLSRFSRRRATYSAVLLALATWELPALAADYCVPPAAMQDDQPDDAAFEAGLKAAIATGGVCLLPAGTLVLTHYPAPLRQDFSPGVAQSVSSLNNATLRGQGSSTLIKGVSAGGFDVLSLNGVSNFNIENLALTVSTSGPLSHGSNGISMTNGTHDIHVDHVQVTGLPYVQASDHLDGGKAFTVQTGQYNQAVQMKNIYVQNSSSKDVLIGFEMDADTNANVEPDNIVVDGNTFEGYLAGILFSFVKPNQPMAAFGAAVTNNAAMGGKYGIVLSRGRAYYLKANYVVLRDDLARPMFDYSSVNSRQAIVVWEVPYLTAELNTFQVTGATGVYFLTGSALQTTTDVFRQNHFYGYPPQRTSLQNSSADYASFFDAMNTFY